jgi:hypothetical protein
MIQERLAMVFKELRDPRSIRNQRHPFFSIIGISLLAAIGGHDSYSGMADFAECLEDELNSYLCLTDLQAMTLFSVYLLLSILKLF